MREINAIASAAVETKWGLRPVILASDVNNAMGANLITEFYPSKADPSHNIGSSIAPSPHVAVMLGDQATRLKEIGTGVFEAVEHEIDGTLTGDQRRPVGRVRDQAASCHVGGVAVLRFLVQRGLVADLQCGRKTVHGYRGTVVHVWAQTIPLQCIINLWARCGISGIFVRL